MKSCWLMAVALLPLGGCAPMARQEAAVPVSYEAALEHCKGKGEVLAMSPSTPPGLTYEGMTPGQITSILDAYKPALAAQYTEECMEQLGYDIHSGEVDTPPQAGTHG